MFSTKEQSLGIAAIQEMGRVRIFLVGAIRIGWREAEVVAQVVGNR
jgi:hypothetical protein